MCLTKSDLSGGLYKIPNRIGLDLGKKTVNKNTFGITAKPLFVLYVYIRNIVYFINFWQKAIYIYVNKVHSSFCKDIPFIPALIFAKAVWIIVKVVSRKITIMKRKYVKQVFILNSINLCQNSY